MDYSVEATERTPKVVFNNTTNELLLEGICIPELTHDFFKPIIAFVHEVGEADIKTFTLTVKLHFFNTGSSRYILELMKTIQKLKEKGVAIKYKWFYNDDDEDIEEAGTSYAFILDEVFEMIPVKV
jgi:SiaC family regulatory phosphoprotein